MKNIGLFSLLLLFCFTSCREDVRIVDTTQNTPDPVLESYTPPVEDVTAGVIGFIVDENSEPVANATISLGDQTLATDDYGHFIIENETMNALGTLVKVEKEGFFPGSRRFFPVAGQQSKIKIQLLEKSFDKTFNTSDGGTVLISNGAAVEFMPNSIQTAGGSVYSGTVHVAAKWMDPSALATVDQMPGNLQGLNSQIEQMALGTFGMIAVELEGDAGESLNIAEGSTATITMPVPASMLSEAPAEIPLWSYHSELGLWIEESMATLQGNNYVGDVSHFSFWNCDIPYDYVELEMTLLDENGLPVAGALVTLSVSNSNITGSGSGITNDEGTVSGFIPANEVLTMEVFDPCGDVLYTNNIGPFDMDTVLPDLTISGANLNSTTISGRLLDCNGAPVTKGVVTASFDGITIYHYTNSADFSMNFTSCSASSDIEVIGIDLLNFEQSDVLTAVAHTDNTLGDINACGAQLQNYISITVDGVNEVFVDVTGGPDAAGRTYIEAKSQAQIYYVGFGFDGITVGDYTNAAYVEAIFHSTLNWDFSAGQLVFNSFVIDQFDTVLKGSFTGEVDQGGVMLPITCEFNIQL